MHLGAPGSGQTGPVDGGPVDDSAAVDVTAADVTEWDVTVGDVTVGDVMGVAPGGAGEGELLAFGCPRCDAEVRAAYYGPCEACRKALRATVAADARHVEAAAYEPKMNVTPNAVATKD
jgi:hypothetical protein